MAGKKITIRLQGSPKDRGDVRLSVFIEKMNAFKKALIETERLITNSNKPTVYYRIVDASHNSPMTIVLEANPTLPIKPTKKFPDYSDVTVDRLFSNLKSIKSGKIKRGDMDINALKSYYKICDSFGDDVSGIDIKNGESEITVDADFVEAVRELLGKEEISFGSITGKALATNFHDKNVFLLYPSAGQTRISCTFNVDLQNVVKNALLKYIRVTGLLKYMPTDKYPYEIEVYKIEELKEEKDLPTLTDLRGIISSRKKEKSENIIRKKRDGNW